MSKFTRKFLYRAFCIASLLIAIYLLVDLKVSRTLDIKMTIIFVLFLILNVWGMIDWRSHYVMIEKQEEELRMYRLYINPLEELVKEIRARQHEFDNHKNAILNMHITIDNYEELVKKQSEYIKSISEDDGRRFMPLLRISDKVLAGFLYSKIVSTEDFIKTDIQVRNLEILSKVSEHSLIEVAGTLVDNAYEACTKELCTEKLPNVIMILDSKADRLIFEIKNQAKKMTLDQISHFFEKGYSTKGSKERRGLGLYRAKMLIDKHRGQITVSQENIEDYNYICFKVVL